eukprot:3790952-Amphidinium_carterae.1
MAGESPQRGRIATPDGFDALKSLLMKDFAAKLEEKEEELWRRGQVEMRKLQQEQQQMAARMVVMQDRETSLMAEMSTLRRALLDVTSKFEFVVKDMREVLRSMPQKSGGGMSPSVLSTMASPNIIKGEELNLAGTPASTGREPLHSSHRYTPISMWGATTEESSIIEMPSFDKAAEGRIADFCTPPRRSGAEHSAMTRFPSDSGVSQGAASSCSPAVLSLATALPSVALESPHPYRAPSANVGSPGLTPLQLAACLDRQEHESNSPGSVQAVRSKNARFTVE